MPHSLYGWAPLQPILHDILLANSDGLSEYELFQQLKSPPYKLFAAEALQDPLSLFQSHFILFNALYQLRDTWIQNETGLLQIHCSRIYRTPWEVGKPGVIKEDKLRTYYLDATNLSDTDLLQVEALLDTFWSAFSGMPNKTQNNAMPLQQAQDLLDLTSPYSAKQLKLQYRKMLHLHHPDKGGNNSHTVQLHNAYERLKTELL
jgi:hypothetical protein